MPKRVRESSIEKAIGRYCKSQGWLYLKLLAAGWAGFPDRTVLKPGGTAEFYEIKAHGGRVSKLQTWWVDKLRAYGFEAHIVYSLQEFREIQRGLGVSTISSEGD